MPFDPTRALPPYLPDAARYERMPYRRVGRSGIQLPAISLGLWQNFGDDRPLAGNRSILRRAFDLGITHFDLANNYGPPYGAAETNFGRIFAEDFRPYRDELIISSKAGYDQWPGPYAGWGSTTSTSSTRIASIRTHRCRRRWVRSTAPCARARRCMSGSAPTRPSARRRRSGS